MAVVRKPKTGYLVVAKAAILVLVVSVVGCDSGGSGGGVTPPANGVCATRSGLYRESFTQESGNCGPVPDSVFNADDPNLGAGVMGMAPTGNACMGTVDITLTTMGDTLHEVGTVMWNADSSRGSAHVGDTITDATTGVQLCSGIYTITFTRF